MSRDRSPRSSVADVCDVELTTFRFYYADERKPDGSPKFRVDGAAHAELYWELSRGETQGPWMQTFVKGEGYRDFGGKYTPTSR